MSNKFYWIFSIGLVLLAVFYINMAFSDDAKEVHNVVDSSHQVQELIPITTEKSDLFNNIIKGKTYHVLIDEYFVTNDEKNPQINIMYREYEVYDGKKNSSYLAISSISLSKQLATMAEAKEYLLSTDSDWLQLKPLTIVSDKVLSQWEGEGYEADMEYWRQSPKGLTIEQIIKGNY